MNRRDRHRANLDAIYDRMHREAARNGLTFNVIGNHHERCSFGIGILDLHRSWRTPATHFVLTSFYVNAGWRKQGYGGQMLRMVLRAADHGGFTIHLRVKPYGKMGVQMARVRLERWYRKHGFAPGRWPGYWTRVPVRVSSMKKAA